MSTRLRSLLVRGGIKGCVIYRLQYSHQPHAELHSHGLWSITSSAPPCLNKYCTVV